MPKLINYTQLTKLDKSRSKSLKKAIFRASQKLGSGFLSPVPYDTAWVARIPELDKSIPAFPESLQWLRDHQSEDGSWGADYPLSLHSKTLNTFAAILAFAQWNYIHDKVRIERGIKALETIVDALPHEETEENAFEMVVSSFLDDAREYKLDLAYKQFEWYSKIGRRKLQKIGYEMVSNKSNKYWCLLEAAGSMDLKLSSYKSEITRYGLIAAQPSTTAFLLRYARLRGEDFPEAEFVFEKVCAQNQGGIPHLIPIDNFEIINGLDFLFKVGINPGLNPKYAPIQKATDVLVSRIDSRNGIGFSSTWPIADEECTVTALSVMQQILGKTPDLTDRIEKNRKLSSYEVFHFESKTLMKGIQNVSLYYTLLQYVFAVPENGGKTLLKIEHIISNSQNSDGGWGGKTSSSVEETSYVCLAVYRLVQIRKNALDSIDFSKLVKFMNSIDSIPKTESFWCYKVVCGSTTLTETLITAAKYSIFQMQRLIMFTNVFNDNTMDFLDIEYWNEMGQLVDRCIFPVTCADMQRKDIEVNESEIQDMCMSILQIKQSDMRARKQIDIAIDASYCICKFKISPYDRAGIVIFILAVNWIDAIIECSSLKEIDESLKIVSKILRGNCDNIATLRSFNLPKIDLIWQCCLYIRKMIEKNNWNGDSLATVFEKWVFKGASLWCRIRRYGIEPTSKEYLEISKLDFTVIECAYFSSLIQDSTIDFTEFHNDELFMQYCKYASKAARLLGDVPSVFKDMELSQKDNYCILLMHEYGISLSVAVMKALKKGIKEFMKMYCLKKIILERESVNKDKLVFLVNNIEGQINRGLVWVHKTERYQAGQTFIAKKVPYEKKDLKFIWDLCLNQE